MPILPNAKKRLRRDRRKTTQNLRIKNKVKTIVKSIREFVKEGKFDDAKKELPNAQKAIDKAAKSNIIHKKNADRKKSRLMGFIKRSEQEKTTKDEQPKETPKKVVKNTT